jgi:hypothetical protein
MGDAAQADGKAKEDVDAPAEDKAAVVGEDTAAAPVCMAGDDDETLERAAKHKRGRKRGEASAEGRNRAVPWSHDEHKYVINRAMPVFS